MYIPEWVFGIIIVVGFYYYHTYKKRKKLFDEFNPFYIHVWPNWFKIFKEYNLIKNEEEWQKITGKIKEDKTHGNPLIQGIRFTFLKQDEKSDLIYLNNYNTFHTEVNFRFPITEIEIDTEKIFGSRIFSFSPIFYIKWGIDGYEIGITTPESSSKIIMVGDDNDLIKISMLPYGLFHLPRYRFGILTEEQVEQLLKKDNWKLEEQDTEERLAKWPITLENEYFTVHYKYI